MAGNIKAQGHHALADLRRGAKRRLALAAVVGVGCFLTGIGLVAALHAPVSGEGPSNVEQSPAPAAPSAGPEAAAVPPRPNPVAATKSQPQAAPTTPENPPDAAPLEDPSKPEPVEGAWWEAVRGQRCAIKFGAHPKLIVREGSLSKDSESTYGPFVDAPILLRVRAARNPVVVPKFFGFHPRGGKPALVYGTVHQQGTSVEGVLPLKIGDDFLELVPER
jgi:hypothetical protein